VIKAHSRDFDRVLAVVVLNVIDEHSVRLPACAVAEARESDVVYEHLAACLTVGQDA